MNREKAKRIFQVTHTNAEHKRTKNFIAAVKHLHKVISEAMAHSVASGQSKGPVIPMDLVYDKEHRTIVKRLVRK